MIDHFRGGRPVFRVYHKVGKRAQVKFTDYEIAADEFEVVIQDKWVSFKGEYLDWNDKVLGKGKVIGRAIKDNKKDKHHVVVNLVTSNWEPYCKITKKKLRRKK